MFNNKVLIADDDSIVRTLYSRILANIGLTIILAKNGLEALEKVKQCNPDLVILDIIMPEMNGYQVCRQIKSKTPVSYTHLTLPTTHCG